MIDAENSLVVNLNDYCLRPNEVNRVIAELTIS